MYYLVQNYYSSVRLEFTQIPLYYIIFWNSWIYVSLNLMKLLYLEIWSVATHLNKLQQSIVVLLISYIINYAKQISYQGLSSVLAQPLASQLVRYGRIVLPATLWTLVAAPVLFWVYYLFNNALLVNWFWFYNRRPAVHPLFLVL